MLAPSFSILLFNFISYVLSANSFPPQILLNQTANPHPTHLTPPSSFQPPAHSISSTNNNNLPHLIPPHPQTLPQLLLLFLFPAYTEPSLTVIAF